MKKLLSRTLIVATAILVLATATVSAHGGHRRNYVDVNGDGVCDNYGGYCGGRHGRYYVDADGDGVCDNYGVGCGWYQY